MRQGEAAFVDSGAWIALALSRDPLHAQAREQWNLLRGAGAKLHTSVLVVIETFDGPGLDTTRQRPARHAQITSSKKLSGNPLGRGPTHHNRRMIYGKSKE